MARIRSIKPSRYREMLALPQWQKRRLQMLEKAGWKCVECGAEEQQLHVHHKQYIAGAKPWEYEDEDLAVLCERCHERAHGIETGHPKPGARLAYPSIANTLLRLVMQHPTWAARLPVDLIPGDSPEGLALIAIIDLLSLGEAIPAGGLGALIERFRDTPHGDTLARVAAELVGAEFDESAVEALLEEVVRRLRADDLATKIGVLLQKDRKSGLTDEDRAHLAALLLKKCEMTNAFKEGAAAAKACESEERLRPANRSATEALNKLRAAKGLPPWEGL